MAWFGGNSTFGRSTRSPARAQKPRTELMQSRRYDTRLLQLVMLTPVPPPVPPRRGGADDARRLQEVVERYVGAPRGVLRRERLDRPAETLDAVDVLAHERLVDETVAQQDVQDAGDQRGVLVRAGLQVDVRETGRLGAAGVDDDELHPALHRAVQLPRRILADELLRDDGVGADEEPDVGLLQNGSGRPATDRARRRRS